MSKAGDAKAPFGPGSKDQGRRGGGEADLYARLFDDAPFAVSVHEGPDHLYRFTNARGRALLGGKPYLGRPFRAVWPSLALMGAAARYDQAYVSGEAVTVPTFRVPPVPSSELGPSEEHEPSDQPAAPPRWARQSLHPWRGPDGAVRGVVSIVHDVEAEARAAEAERRAALRLGAAMDATAVVGVWDWDTEAGTVHADAGLAALFGLEGAAGPGPLTPEQFGAAMHPEDRERVFARIDRTARQGGEAGGDYADEFRVRDPDGRVRTVQTVGHRGQGNEDDGVIHGLTFDVTARRAAEAALLSSEARLDAALRAADLGVVDVDHLTGTARWDSRARELWGFGPDEPVDTAQVWARIHPEDETRVREATEAATRRACEAPDGVARYALRHRVVRPASGSPGGADEAGDVVWVRAAGTVHCPGGTLARVIGIVADASEEEARRAVRTLTVRELGHRVRNTLTVVQAIATQTFRGVAGAAEPLRAFAGRLQAFAAAQTDLMEEGAADGDLGGVIHRAVHACAPMEQVEIEGPPVRLPQRTAQMMALAAHELCTNATKYGALSVPEGRVRIAWKAEDGEAEDGEAGTHVRLVWAETGGPEVSPPERRGFGSTLIEQAVAGGEGGRAGLDYRPEGLVCTLDFTTPAPKLSGEPTS